MNRLTRLASCGFALSLVCSPLARAQTIWDGGGTNDNWSTATNWVGDVAPALVTTNFITLAGGIRLTPNVNSNWSFQGLILSNGAFTLSGSNLTLTANANVAAGPNVFEQSSPSNAVINNNIILPATTTNPRRQFYLFGAGAVTFNGGITNTGTGETAVFIRGDGAGQGRINGRVTIGTNKVSKTENSIWTIANAANQWGPTDLGGTSTVRIAVNDALPTNTFITFSNGARLDLSNLNQTVVGLTGTGVVRTGLGAGGRFTVADDGSTSTYFGTIVENGSVLKRGAGTLNLSGVNTFTGGLSVADGTVRIAAGGKLQNSPANSIVISNGATLALSNVNAFATDHNTVLTNLITVQAGGTLKGEGKEMRLGNIVLNGGTILVDGGSATYGTFYLPETVTVAGASASLMTNTAAANGFLPLGPSSVFVVGDVTASAATDLEVYARLADRPNNAGWAGLTKSGTGTMALHNSHSLSGTVAVTAGRLTIATDGSLSNATVNVGAGAILDVVRGGTYAMPEKQTILGNGAVTGGSLSVSGGARLAPGTLGGAGTLTVNADFAMSATYTNYFDLTNNTTAGGGNDLLVVNAPSAFDPANAQISVNPLARMTTGTYRLINYTGAKGASFASPVLGNKTRDVWAIDEATAGQINLVVSGVTNASLIWSANANANWDLGTTNWTDAALLAPDRFYENDVVLFSDAGGASNLVTITAQVKPYATTVNSASNYTFQGAGRISGIGGSDASLTKDGSGTLTILNTNDYPGMTIVSNGAIVVGNGGNVGSLGVGTLWVEAPGSITYYRNDTFNLASAMGGAGTMVFRSTGGSALGSYTFTGLSTGFVGTIVATNARVAVDSVADLGSATQVVAQSGGQIYVVNMGLSNPVQIAGTGWLEGVGILGAVRLQGGSLLGPVALTAPARIAAYGNDGSVAGPISGAYELEFWSSEAAGRTIRIGADAPQTYGSTRISSNITVWATNANALGTGALVLNRGTLRVNGNDMSFASLSSTASGGTLMNGSSTAATITVGSDGSSQNFGGTLVNGINAPGGQFPVNLTNASLGLVKTGAGTLTLANNTASGTNLVQGGTLALTNGSWSGPLSLGASGTAVLAGGEGLIGEYYAVIAPTSANFSTLSALNANLAQYAPLVLFKSSTALTNCFDFGGGGAGFPPGFSVAATSNLQVRWTGRFLAPSAGDYSFYTTSDDGSMLWVDGVGLVTNNAFQGLTTRTGTVTLATGPHEIVVAYYQGGGGYGFNAEVLIPGGVRSKLTNSLLLAGAGIGGLSGAAGSTLYLSNGISVIAQAQNGTFAGTLAGDGGLRKAGPAVLSLVGTQSYTDATVVAGGQLAVDSSLPVSPVTVVSGGTLGGTGSIATAVSIQEGAQLNPALAGTVGQLALAGPVAFANTATAVVDFVSGTNDTFAVTGSLDGNGAVVAVNPTVALVDGTYPIAPYGSLVNPFRTVAVNLNPGTGGAKSLLVDHSQAGLVRLTVAARPTFVAWNSASNTAWEVAGALNWSNGVTALNDVFYNGDAVLFDDRANVTQIVAIAAGVTVQPTVVTFNNAVNIYTVQLAGAMSGTGSIVKTGTGSVTIADTTASAVNRNLLSGDTLVNGGRLVLTGPNDGTPVLGLGQVVINPGGIVQADASNVFGLQQTGFVQRIVANGGTLRPNANTHFNQLVLRSNATVEAHTSATGAGLDAYAISNVLAQISVESSTSTITNAAKITIGNSTSNTIFSTEDGPAVLDAEFSGQLVLAGDTRYALFTNTGTTVLSGTGDNAFFRTIVTAGRLILAKTSSASIHAIGGSVSNLVINGGTVQLAGSGGDQIATSADVFLNDGVLDLNGLTEGYDALGGTGGTIQNGVAGTISSNTVGQSGNGSTYGGTIQNGAGIVAFAKSGSGTEVLTGTNTFTGTAWVQEGTLVLSNAGANAIATTEIFLNDGSGNAVLQLGLPNQIPDNAVLTYRSGSSGGNSGKLQMMGQTETIGDILVAAGNQSVIQNSETEVINVDGTLTIAGSGNSVLPEVVRDRSGGTGTGRLAIAKAGSGTLLVAGGITPIYTGPTTINGGTLFVNGTLATAAAPVTVNGGILAGTGVVNRAVVVAAGGTVQPGHLTNYAALAVASLNANAGGTLNLLAGGTGAILRVTGNNGFTIPSSGQATVVVQTALAIGTYTVLDYTGTVQGGSIAANLALSVAPRATASLVNNTGNTTIDLNLTALGEGIKWTGAANNLWDINSSIDWKTQTGLADTTYLQPGAVGDTVLFDDSASGNFSVDLTATVSPADLIVSNDLNNYVLSGQGIAGAVGLTKHGAASLTLSNMNLSYSGVTLVNGGALKLDTLNGFAGSLVNNSTTELAAASGGWDLGNGRTISGGGLFTKTGSGTVSLNNSSVSASGAISVVAGTLRNSGNGTVWTSASADLDVASGANFDVRGDAVRVDAVSGAGAITNSYGNNQIETLTIGVANGSATFSGTIRDSGTQFPGENLGSLGVTKMGSGTQTFAGVNSYVGPTVVDQGTLAYTADNTVRDLVFGSAPGSTNVPSLDLSAASLTAGSWTNIFTRASVTGLVTIGSGRALTVNGLVTIGALQTNRITNLKMAGGGAFVVGNSNGTFRVSNANGGTANGSSSAVLDMNELATAVIDLGTNGTLTVGSGDNSAGFAPSYLFLAATTTVTAANLNIGPTANGSQHVLILGSASNRLNVDTLSFGTGARDRAYVGFTNATGTLTVRDRAGTGRATLNFSRLANDGTGYAGDGVIDLRDHYSDLLLSTLNIGVAGRNGNLTNTLWFNSGVLDLQQLRMAILKGNGTNIAILNIGGGTVNIGTNGVMLASNAVSYVNLTGGTITSGSDFERGTNGTGAAFLTLAGASLNMTGRKIGTPVALTAVTLDAGTLANVGELNNGAPWAKTSTGTLTIAGSNGISGPGFVSNGTLVVNGTLGTGGVTTVAGTTLRGSGVIGGSLTAEGLVSPGSSAGLLTIGGDYVLSASTATQLVEIGGTTPGSGYDQIVVSNFAAVTASLEVQLIGGHTPVAGNTYTILVAAAVGGPFGTVSLPALATNLGWDVQYTGAAVVLAVTGGVSVTGYDLAATVIGNGLTGYNDDADGDGYANLLEYVTGGSLTNPGTQARMNAARTNNVLALKFSRDTAATDATIYVEGSFTATNGANWIGIATNIAGSWGAATNVNESGASPVSVTVQDTIPAATNRFLRLRVTRP